MADIHIKIDSGPEAGEYVLELNARKTLDGNIIVRDHPDVDPLSYGNPIYNEDDYIRLAVKAEKELLIQCIKIPGYAAKRLQSHFGYTMLELQQLKEK